MKRIRILEFNLLFGIIFLCGGCSINVVGKYSSIRCLSSFQFKGDSTFMYKYRSYHLYQYSRGKWEWINRNMITLTSDIKDITIPLSVKEIGHIDGTTSNIISIDLDIKNSQSLADYMCEVYINDVLYCIRRCDSIASIPVTVPIRNCYFNFTKDPQIALATAVSPPLLTNKYRSNSSIMGNKLIIAISFDDSYFFYKAFNDDTIRVKKQGIRIFNPDLKKWKKISKVSDESNIFSRFNNTLQQ